MIRKLLFVCLLLVLAASSQAQILLNGSFEDSTITTNDTVPRFWSADYFGFGFTTDAFAGNQAAEIWNWYSYARGWLIYGAATNTLTGGGQPVSVNPDRLTGVYKYIYGDNGGALDSAICEILVFSHQNFTGARDTVGRATHHFGPQAEYTAFDIPIHYTMPGLAADTVVVKFISSISGFCNPTTECLYLYLDALELGTPLGTSQPLTPLLDCQLLPSPSANGFRMVTQDRHLFPATLTFTDMQGRMVFETTVIDADPTWIEPHLPAGIYAWKAQGPTGATYAGKWQSQ